MKNKRGFSLVELLVAITILGVLSTAAYLAVGRSKTRGFNDRMQNDLLAISNALEQYKRDHYGKYPVPSAGSNQNVLCYDAAATYAHDCSSAAFVQGMIDNALLTKRYLSEVPLDPRTGSRYVYGVTQDGQYFMVAGLYENEDGTYSARTVENLGKGYSLPSLIRAYNGPNFVINKASYLPYNPHVLEVTATLDNINGEVRTVPSGNCSTGPSATAGATIYAGAKICTNTGASVDIYFSDGSLSYLGENTEIELPDLSYARNDGTATVSKILIQLKKGKIWSKVVRLASESEFRVQTTTQIAGVRGTEFSAESLNGGPITLAIKSGEVWLDSFTSNADKIDTRAKAEAPGSGATFLNPVTAPGYIPYAAEVNVPLSNDIRPRLTLVDGAGSLIKIAAPNAIFNGDGRVLRMDRVAVYANSTFVGGVTVTGAALDSEISVPVTNLSTLNDVQVRFEEIVSGAATRASSFSIPPVTVGAAALNESDLNTVVVALETPEQPAPPAPTCGNGAIDSGEQCDGTNLNSQTCATVLGTGTTGTLSCSASCQLIASGCVVAPTPAQTCTNGGGVWRSTDSTCLTAKQAACYGADLVADGVAGITADDKGYWDGSACWVLGATGASCTSACTTASANLACDTSTLWNDDASFTVCGELNPGATVKSTLLVTDTTYNPVAPFKSSTFCRTRNSSFSITNSALCSNTNGTVQRFCKCQ
jgi:prepilin-type N-terminal cleavage/methylation domain-containing protein